MGSSPSARSTRATRGSKLLLQVGVVQFRIGVRQLAGGDAADNAKILLHILAGEPSGARTAVVLNVACALTVAGLASDLREGRARAEEAIDRGDALRTLDKWRARTPR